MLKWIDSHYRLIMLLAMVLELIFLLLLVFIDAAHGTASKQEFRVIGLELSPGTQVYVVKEIRPDHIAILEPMIPLNIGIDLGEATLVKNDVLHCRALTTNEPITMRDGSSHQLHTLVLSCDK